MSGLDAAHDALDRMKRAAQRNTGCHLTAEMISALACSIVGQMWEQDRPAATIGQQDGGK